jgi:hypothetical protein
MHISKNDAPRRETTLERRHHPINGSRVSPGEGGRKVGSFTSTMPSRRRWCPSTTIAGSGHQPKTGFHPDLLPKTSVQRIGLATVHHFTATKSNHPQIPPRKKEHQPPHLTETTCCQMRQHDPRTH